MTKSYTLKLGDCHTIMDQLHENSVDAIVTDPPYEINFMAKTWDNAGVAFNPITWQKALRVLKPGGHMLVFGHSRKMHRIIVAIEDAGFEIRDTLMWLYGSGFPKSHNISKGIDKKLGAERETVGRVKGAGKQDKISFDNNHKDEYDVTSATTPQAKQYDGWGTALKPAYEPIVLVRKPFKGSIVENVLEHGTGGINIDECRVDTNGEQVDIHHTKGASMFKEGEYQNVNRFNQTTGRFPANVIHDGSEEVTSGFPDTSSGYMNSNNNRNTNGSPNGIYGKFDKSHPLSETYGDSGNASRFFYTAKASKKDRDEGLSKFEKQYEGWGTALKPAYEPIVLARKPFKGSIAENVLEHGTGGINIDECRILSNEPQKTSKSPDFSKYKGSMMHLSNLKQGDKTERLDGYEWKSDENGRFPANVIHDGSEEVTSGFPEVGGGNNNGAYNYEGMKYANKENSMFNGDEPKAPSNYNDSGNASRFFYTAKASKKDRDEGLDIYQEKQTGELQGGRKENSAGSKMPNDGRLNPYAGAGAVRRNPHPTVKPTDLMQYLVRLITPKGGTVLDPFMGSGSTGKAAMIENNERNANYHFIGIDLTEEYLDIAKARIEYGKHYFQNKEKEAQNVDENQTTLFDWEWD